MEISHLWTALATSLGTLGALAGAIKARGLNIQISTGKVDDSKPANQESGTLPRSYWNGRFDRLEKALNDFNPVLDRITDLMEKQSKGLEQVVTIQETQEKRYNDEQLVKRVAAAVAGGVTAP